MSLHRRPEAWVFLILWASYAYFWQSRDWNSASRLMLTYAVVDRGRVEINGLEDHTHDRAYVRGRYYTDKLPGFSLLAVVPYTLARRVLGLPPHPLGVPGKDFAHWPADYWVTLGTSGLLTAAAGAILVRLARSLGCGPRRAALVGLAYGLGTPAFAYATLAYGHQAAAFGLLASFALLWPDKGRRPKLEAAASGFLAASASVVELQVGPVSAVLGVFMAALVAGGRRKADDLGLFALGAAVPTLVLLGYNQLAFGSPWESGYFHLTTSTFAEVHSAGNPLGLARPEAARALALVWGRHRGLLFYAPVVALVPLGLVAMAARRYWGGLAVSASAMAAVFAVNLSYPAWTGGWSTGPRLLVPLIPFAMIPVAALLARPGRGWTRVAAALSLAGAVLMLLFVGVGARLPQYYLDPLREAVWPLWRGRPVPGWPGPPFARNLCGDLAPAFTRGLAPAAACLQFLPLVLFQASAVAVMLRAVRVAPGTHARAAGSVVDGGSVRPSC